MWSLDVLVPGSALLVPGVSGRADPAAEARTEVLAALRAAVATASPVRAPHAPGSEADEPVRPVPGPHTAITITTATSSGGLHPVPDLGAAGVAERWLEWSFDGNDDRATGRADVATSVALLALGAAGWTGSVEVRFDTTVPVGSSLVTVARDAS